MLPSWVAQPVHDTAISAEPQHAPTAAQGPATAPIPAPVAATAPVAAPAPVAPALSPVGAGSVPQVETVAAPDGVPAPTLFPASPVAVPHLDRDDFDSDPIVAPELHESVLIDASGSWYSPGTALVVAMAALAWRLVDAYAGSILPQKIARGSQLDIFDTIIKGLPIGGNMPGTILSYVLMGAAVVLLGAGWRLRVREPFLQVSVAVVVMLAAAGPFIAR